MKELPSVCTAAAGGPRKRQVVLTEQGTSHKGAGVPQSSQARLFNRLMTNPFCFGIR